MPPWKGFRELIDYAKEPGKSPYGKLTAKGLLTISIWNLSTMTGVQFSHIPFKGGPEVVTALLGGILR